MQCGAGASVPRVDAKRHDYADGQDFATVSRFVHQHRLAGDRAMHWRLVASGTPSELMY